MLHLRTLGTLDLRRDDGTELLSVVSQPKRIGLLCYLALACPRGFHRRDTLLALFWPEADDEHARASLRQAVHYLRRSLGEQVVLSRGDEEVGLAPGQLVCDAVAFEEALDAGDAERALGLYQGELLPGLYVEGAPELERWLEAERARVRERALRGARELAEARERAGDAPGAAQWARRALELAPTDERVLRACMELLDRVGEAGAAGEAYEGYARRLREDEEEPSAELKELAEEIRRRGKSSRGPRAQSGASPQQSPPPQFAASAVPTPAPASASSPGIDSAAVPTVVTAPPTGEGSPHARRRRAWPRRRFALIGLAAVLVAAVIVGFTLHTRGPHGATGAELTSIAVLPLADVSPGGSQAYFADGLTSELIEVLGQVPGLRVVGPTSSFLLKGKNLPLKEIARQLKVAHVVEGTVLRDGPHVRVTVRLSNALTDRQLASQSYETANGDPSTIQRDIARYIAARLSIKPGELPLRPPTSPDAYDLYLQAMLASRNAPYGTFEGREGWAEVKAIELYRRVLALDPRFAPAWAGLALAHYRAGSFAAAEEEARRALALDSTLPTARHALAASLAFGRWRWTEAEQEYNRGIRLAPSAAILYSGRALIRFCLGRKDEALFDQDRAESLDPLSTDLVWERGLMYLRWGQFQQAVRTFERIPRDQDPATLSGRFVGYTLAGDRARAAEIALAQGYGKDASIVLRADPQEALRYGRRPGAADSVCQTAFALQGTWSMARSRRQADSARAASPAELHDLLSLANELWFQCVEAGIHQHYRWAGITLRWWGGDSIRSQPRFQRLMREVGLPE